MGTHTTMMKPNNTQGVPSCRRYGWKRQLPDKRDLTFEFDACDLPDSFDLRDELSVPPIYNQGALGSCTANALAAAFEFNERKEGYGDEEFTPSRLFIYYNERVMEGTTPTEDSGAALRDGIKSLNLTGVCPETGDYSWPYDVAAFSEKPPVQCYDAAYCERALHYRRVAQNVDAMKHALFLEKEPVVFGFSVYESFESEAVSTSGIMPMPKPGEKQLGGHAVLCVGYDDTTESFIIRNSWGEEWGSEGYFSMPYKFLTDPDYANDFWIITSVSSPPVAPGNAGYDVQFPELKPAQSNEGIAADKHDDESPAEESLASPTLRLTGAWSETGSECESGRVAKITWETEGSVPRVMVQYCCNSWSGMLSSWTTAIESVGNHGNYRWHVPDDLPSDSRYLVRVASVENSSIYCVSEHFAIRVADV